MGWAAYAKCHIAVGDRLGIYEGCSVSSAYIETPTSYLDYIWMERMTNSYVDAAEPDTCALRYVNDRFQVNNLQVESVCVNGRWKIAYLAERDLHPNEPLGAPYGGEYWYHIRWPESLLRQAADYYPRFIIGRKDGPLQVTPKLWQKLIQQRRLCDLRHSLPQLKTAAAQCSEHSTAYIWRRLLRLRGLLGASQREYIMGAIGDLHLLPDPDCLGSPEVVPSTAEEIAVTASPTLQTAHHAQPIGTLATMALECPTEEAGLAGCHKEVDVRSPCPSQRQGTPLHLPLLATTDYVSTNIYSVLAMNEGDEEYCSVMDELEAHPPAGVPPTNGSLQEEGEGVDSAHCTSHGAIQICPSPLIDLVRGEGTGPVKPVQPGSAVVSTDPLSESNDNRAQNYVNAGCCTPNQSERRPAKSNKRKAAASNAAYRASSKAARIRRGLQADTSSAQKALGLVADHLHFDDSEERYWKVDSTEASNLNVAFWNGNGRLHAHEFAAAELLEVYFGLQADILCVSDARITTESRRKHITAQITDAIPGAKVSIALASYSNMQQKGGV